MPLSFGVPLGLILALGGAVLFFVTNHKKLARVMIGIGIAIALLTLLVIILVVNSSM
jgi:hypothetical protein